jgi:hypothetical protein
MAKKTTKSTSPKKGGKKMEGKMPKPAAVTGKK